jgi:protein tyrosine/serine phosphatase
MATDIVSNFHRVNDSLYRGGQPDAQSLAALGALPVRTIVSLRWRKQRIESERALAENLGLRFVSIPLNYWTLPSDASVQAFLKVMDDESNHPVYIHCFHGADRTGVLVAMYRILREHWTLHEAYNEMRACGFHRFSTAHFKLALWRLARRAAKEAQAQSVK